MTNPTIIKGLDKRSGFEEIGSDRSHETITPFQRIDHCGKHIRASCGVTTPFLLNKMFS